MKADLQVSRAVDQLSTISGFDPHAILLRLCEVLHSLDHASAALAYRPVITQSGPRVADICGIGDGIEQLASRFVNGYPRITQELATVSAAYNPALIRKIETRAFVEMSRVVPDEVLAKTRTFGEYLDRAGVIDQQRLLVVHDGCFLGWVGYMRYRGERRFDQEDGRRLTRLVPPVAALLTAAHRLCDQMTPAEPGDLVLRPDGHVEFSSLRGQEWLAVPGFTEALRQRIRELDSGGEQVTALPSKAEARIVRIDGGGQVRYLVNVRRCTLRRIPPSVLLTPVQREVATLVCSGATLPEIGGMMRLSVHTVRTHLRAIYRTFHVASRAELTRALAE